MIVCNICITVYAVRVACDPDDDAMGLKHVGQIYKNCKCCNAKTLEYSAFDGQILYLTAGEILSSVKGGSSLTN
jgi:hypothetical protein